ERAARPPRRAEAIQLVGGPSDPPVPCLPVCVVQREQPVAVDKARGHARAARLADGQPLDSIIRVAFTSVTPEPGRLVASKQPFCYVNYLEAVMTNRVT